MKKITLDTTKPIRFLLLRTDKLGDVVLSLQCIEAIKKTYPRSYICFAMQSYTAPLTQNNPFLDEVILTDSYTQKQLTQIIRAKNFDVSISFFASKIACYVPFFAKIPIRIGPLSKLRALLFTHKIYQKRSSSKKNEAQYNLDLLKPLGCQKVYFPKIYLNSKERNQASSYLKNKFGTKASNIIILHPGSGGSSKDWKVENYLWLANKILQTQLAEILITGSQKELDAYAKIIHNFPYLSENNLLDEQKPLREFLGILAEAKLFLSNGTGPLHCAIALNIPTIGFHTLMRSCKPTRWGPFSANQKIHTILTPITSSNKPVPQCISCSTKCPYYLCMDTILPQNVYEIIKQNYLKIDYT